MRVLLVSTSTVFGTGYLEHCLPWFRDLLGGRRLTFVPYALADHAAYTDKVRTAMATIDVEVDSLHEAPDPAAAVAAAQAVFVGGGNTFRLLKTLQDLELLQPIRDRVRKGMPYSGASAGSNLACPTIRTTNDMPIVEPQGFAALGLVPFQINPHYVDTDPLSRHMGETRETRIAEFLEENDLAVVGLREGSALLAADGELTLLGDRPARLFRRRHAPTELDPGSDLSALLG